ncbi:hypothetical protein PR048_020856 [Dryococelus australis]|uniref:Integrase catalytic domain-containing protein n=1 Tax=Dryococelus australis TaxID=614101 RepID=A0ABQ9GWN3_9NEOP|nr:hypothetical protein PR048_020856 [Dryococelus australis]
MIDARKLIFETLSFPAYLKCSKGVGQLPASYHKNVQNNHVEDKLVFLGTKIVVPTVLRPYVINLAHEGHNSVKKKKKKKKEKKKPEQGSYIRYKILSLCHKHYDVFNVHGFAKVLIADNMPFTSYEYQHYYSKYGISLSTCSPHYHRSNVIVEKAVGISKNIVSKSNSEGADHRDLLREYKRTSSISSTNIIQSMHQS